MEPSSEFWGAARPTITMPNGKEVSVGWRVDFHREDGEWKAVQLHASSAVSNEPLLGG